MEETKESKYIQQHLANERTFLAWVRTSIAVIGIGVLASTLHFNNVQRVNKFADSIASSLSLFSLVTGLTILVYSTMNYFQVRKRINQQTYSSSRSLIYLITAVIILIFILLLIYLFVILI
ncbi:MULTISPECIES: YidH family protein [Cytobacillus]|uniref:DUF202 domain-containing protein n=1 Tax=Cytobacillus firmus TaxID=1399 RepID=A0AA46P3W9_CYTFI|nr:MULTISPECIES: DUF202 domain-containing protein [Cytobacillus]MCC3645137.1 DUF202 domain-containing protein [Cytobacillus oceanisediminis]UYG96977.1 DUF202 domain-containing protein [Cytobacillus firmus]WHY35320.1 DUF202 domain-containing protein [Cytobacillus firmus]